VEGNRPETTEEYQSNYHISEHYIIHRLLIVTNIESIILEFILTFKEVRYKNH
jgi:hypothetical protein